MFNFKTMKMGAGMFWGILLILIGLGIVIRVVFNIDFPIVKFIIAFFFIFLGIKILIGNFGPKNIRHDENTTMFGERRIEFLDNEHKEFNVIFGSNMIDLRNVDLSQGSKEIEVNVIFGSTDIKISEKTPVKIKAESVFGSAKMPNGNTASFGSTQYKSDTFSADSNYLYIKTDVVFGGVEIKSY
ncbi:MAG: LiaF domain-containing protein [Bacteroidales bacterium]